MKGKAAEEAGSKDYGELTKDDYEYFHKMKKNIIAM